MPRSSGRAGIALYDVDTESGKPRQTNPRRDRGDHAHHPHTRRRGSIGHEDDRAGRGEGPDRHRRLRRPQPQGHPRLVQAPRPRNDLSAGQARTVPTRRRPQIRAGAADRAAKRPSNRSRLRDFGRTEESQRCRGRCGQGRYEAESSSSHAAAAAKKREEIAGHTEAHRRVRQPLPRSGKAATATLANERTAFDIEQISKPSLPVEDRRAGGREETRRGRADQPKGRARRIASARDNPN